MNHETILVPPLTPPGSAEVVVRLATCAAEVTAAQRLRYRVFFEEMGAKPSLHARATGLDEDDYDAHCDHLLAIAGGEVVGTYRLIHQQAAARVGGFYSASEFDLAPVLAHGGRLLELGRSCVDAGWRNRGTLQALWHGLAEYIADNGIDLLFGCASLPGTDMEQLAEPLSYLHRHHLAPAELRAQALSHRNAPFAAPAVPLRPAAAFRTLPPLLKGYLRAGAWVGEGAALDRDFNTTDVLVILDTQAMAARYQRRYEAAAE
ncbi:MAG: GNAT family N-acetyltransferase [Bacteroidales bacterium]